MNLAQENKKQIISGSVLCVIGLLFGYVIATMILTVWHSEWRVDSLFLLKNYDMLYRLHYREFVISALLIALPAVGGLLLSTRIVEPSLTAFGTTHWQTKAEMKRKHFFANPATGFLLGKTGKPDAQGQHIVSAKFPHCLLVAPTGAGKTVGFVIPNLLTYLGSAVVLDVKGECFEKTARYRESLGHKVFRFGPRDFDMPSHRFNPLHRIAAYTNPAKRMAEIDKLATLFLQAESSQAASFLPNSKDVFIACAILAYEQGNFTLGHVYKLAYGGELDNNSKFANYGRIVKDASARVLFQKLANTAKDTLSAYLSVLSSSGFAPWANPHTCAVTAAHDFDFSQFRRSPNTVYFTVPYDDLRTISPLVRMFFSELIASLQAKEPGPDEPFPVMILLDEFQRIGKMPILVDSLSLLRSYGGNVAIVTQSIPDLDRVYGTDDRKAIQANSGIKLYLTPSEEDTIGELSESVGTTTKKVTTRSRSIKDGVFGSNVTERSEEYPLLTKDDARRLPSDEIVIVINGDMPIRAKRLQYYADRKLKPLYDSQDMKKPAPIPTHIITEADYDSAPNLEQLEQDRADVAAKNEENRAEARASVSEQLNQQNVTRRVRKAHTPRPTEANPVAGLLPNGDEVKRISTNISDLFAEVS
ncbi:type VI secretion protein [Ochrobactrum sp. XJ1]|nr:type VI secretion protein [Ochrobactrum sp. XJ1]